MKKYIDLWEYAGEILEQVGTAALVTTKADGQVNTMTIGWGTLGVEWKKPLFTVFVRQSRHTKQLLDQSGEFTIPGNISSQFITGLLFATVLMQGDSHINITGTLESAPYVTMTLNAMKLFGIRSKDFHIKGNQNFHTPGYITVEGDWSNAAFWLAANALGSDLDIQNLNIQSAQGDRAMIDHLTALHDFAVIDATHSPDLVPILAVTAGAKKGAKFVGCARLRLKETDRLATTAAMINNLGGRAVIEGDDLIVDGTGYRGGIVDALNDHRIAMSAAIAATLCQERVTIFNAHEVKKSYPGFWEDYQKLGGNYELYLR